MQDFARIVKRAYSSLPDEVDEGPLALLEGALPPELRGVLYRNGPGRLERGGVRYGHPFDGDGMVSRFVFDGAKGEVRYTNRFVRTRELCAEESAGRLLYRGFGTNLPGGLRHNALKVRFKNAANTNVVAHGGRLLALWEGGWPHRLCPTTLRTLERFSFGGQLKNDRSPLERLLNPELPFSAHPHLDEETGALYNFGVAFGRKNRLLLWRVAKEGVLDWRSEVELEELTFVHDFLLTPAWLVFFLPRVSFDVPKALLGLKTPVASLQVDEERPMQVLLVPRPGGPEAGAEPRFLEADRGGFVFHHALATEGEGGLQTVSMWMSSFPELGGDLAEAFTEAGLPEAMAEPLRFTLDLEGGRATSERVCEHAAELPRADEAGARFYATAAPPGRKQPFFSSLLSARAVGTADAIALEAFPCLIGEPVPVPVEAGGYVLSLVYEPREHRTELWVLAPETLAKVARFSLPHAQPPGLHGNFLTVGAAEALGAYG